jgi:hypothetical protein
MGEWIAGVGIKFLREVSRSWWLIRKKISYQTFKRSPGTAVGLRLVKQVGWLVDRGGDAADQVAERRDNGEITTGRYAHVWARQLQHCPHVAELHVEY